MRGRLVVAIMLSSGLALLIFSLWFVSSHPPVDERFNLRRNPLEADAPGPMLLLEQIGEFKRESFQAVADGPDGQRQGSAVYRDAEGRHIRLEARTVADPAKDSPEARLRSLYQTFDPNAPGAELKLHWDRQTVFAYATLSGDLRPYHEFTWFNGRWVIRVFTAEADVEALLRFANSCPF